MCFHDYPFSQVCFFTCFWVAFFFFHGGEYCENLYLFFIMFCFLFLSFYFLTVFVLCFISERFCFYPSMRFAALLYALWLEYFFGDHVWRENCLLFLLFLGAYIFSFVNVFIIFIFFLCCFARVLASLVEIVLLLVFEGNVIDGIHAFVWSSRLWILGCFCFLYSRVMKWIWFITSFWVLLFFFSVVVLLSFLKYLNLIYCEVVGW